MYRVPLVQGHSDAAPRSRLRVPVYMKEIRSGGYGAHGKCHPYNSNAAEVRDGLRPCYALSAISRRRSRRFWPVGPVTTASPKAVNMGQASKAASEDFRWNPKEWARETVVGSATAPADRVFPSMPSEPALSTVNRSPG